MEGNKEASFIPCNFLPAFLACNCHSLEFYWSDKTLLLFLLNGFENDKCFDIS